jgi:hypothetical protein
MHEIEDIISDLREVGQRVPTLDSAYPLKEPIFGMGTPEAEVIALESYVQVALPEDFLLFQDIWNGYHLMDATHIKAIMSDADWPLIIQSEDSPTVLMPIGGDGGGNLFLMDLKNEGHVLKWDHETGRKDLVAVGFFEFLYRVLEDWKHFTSGDGGWKYLAG